MSELKKSFRTLSRRNLAHCANKMFADKKINMILKNIIIALLNAESRRDSLNIAESRAISARFAQSRTANVSSNLKNPQNLAKNFINSNRFCDSKYFLKTPKKPKNILLYAPLDLEANIFSLIFDLKKQKNIKIFLPFILQNGKNANKIFKIVPFRLPLARNKFNILEARNSHFARKIDIAIIPILGADCERGRIGFGKGMYDRFCAKYNPKNIIFVSRILHLSNAKISEWHDIKGDFIIASKGKKYDFFDNWTLRGRFSRPVVLSNKKILHKIAESRHRTGKNQSKCD
ncbi:5-formyltetrahydrofolate cyclo-ligase [Helicobacter sp. 23-1044]